MPAPPRLTAVNSSAASSTQRPVDGRYTVLRHLADGGMGSVYVARDERLGRDVALKVMRPDLVSDPAFVERFRQEAQSAASLSDPHAVAVYDQGRDGDIVFLAMEYVEGTTLRHRLDEVGALTPREALAVMDSVLSALSAAHALGIVHRDVKPENVLLRTDGTVKVGDFGLARAVTSRTSTALGRGVLGTFAYVSPEQVSQGVVDARSDVYSAGLMLFELLTGRQAFAGEDPIHVAFRHVNESVPAPSTVEKDLPGALDEAVLAATAIDPDDRPEDASRYRALLRGIASQLTDEQLDVLPQAAATHSPVRRPELDSQTQRLDSGALANRTRLLPTAAPPQQATSSARPDLGAKPEPEPRGRRTGPLWTVLAVLTALLVAGVVWVFTAGPGALRDVPAVAGQSQEAAVAALAEVGFDTEVDRAYSETVERGVVIDTDPAPPDQARALLPVTVRVSQGPERYEVPDVRGQETERARQAIRDAKLAVGSVREEWHEQVPAGSVIGTEPEVGAGLPPGTQVGIVASKGREPIEIEDWTGRPLTEARSSLEDRGITVDVTEERFSDEVETGAVISQNPGPSTLHRGERVRFVVSKGPELVEVPEIQGLQETEAIAKLEDAGFEVTVSRIVGGVFGTARSTDPEAGTSAPRGSTVTLYVV